MNSIPPKLRKEMSEDPFYKKCCLKDEYCRGRIEWHHALTFKGSQIQRKFAIVPSCQFHHERVAIFKKKFWLIALNRATQEELKEFEKANFAEELIRLNK